MQPITFGLGLSISYRARGAFVVEVSDRCTRCGYDRASQSRKRITSEAWYRTPRLSLSTEKSPIYTMCVMTRKMPCPLFRPPQPYTQLCTPFSMVPDGLIVASGS